ncbi:unnamed protein product [Cuscuta campestris]|uniref:Uncharacterized protein n=1 Tax=Cuscuta campestris TaxID=132261 RepID=A0A484K4R9_9ASTE|nr:unnamed protein product [Cuscuta campestris]
MLLHFGKVPALIVSSADAAREVMKTHDLAFANRPESIVTKRLLYDGKDVSVAPYGEYWRQLKSVCVLQLLSNKKVQSFHHIREEETALLTNRIEQSSDPVNLSEMFVELTNNVVCRSAFGRKYSSEGQIGKRFILLLNEFLVLLSLISVGDFIPWLRWIDRVTGFDARAEKNVKALDDFLERVISERVEGGIYRENFVNVLLDINRDSNATGLSIDRDSIKAIILDVFAAITDTTATVLEWAMAELIRHPTVMGKLQTEVRGVMGTKQDMTERDIEKMHYLKAVIKETLRCHMPIPMLVPRTSRKDVKIMGYDIAAGTLVMVNAWAIGRDPALWDEPDRFQPERFLNSSIDFKGQDFELIPFGAGRRGCPGIAFAMSTNAFVLANLVNKFDWKLPQGTKVEDLDMTERPGVAIRRAVPLLVVASRCHG